MMNRASKSETVVYDILCRLIDTENEILHEISDFYLNQEKMDILEIEFLEVRKAFDRIETICQNMRPTNAKTLTEKELQDRVLSGNIPF